MECKHVEWVTAEIQKLVKYGAVRKWADSGIEGEPCIITPLQVEEERTKNRLIYNAQFLNCFMEPPSYKMDGVGRLAQIGWGECLCSQLTIKTGIFTAKYISHRGIFLHLDGKDRFMCL